MYVTHIGLLHKYQSEKRETETEGGRGNRDGGPKANIYVWFPWEGSTSRDIMRHIGSIWLGDKVGWDGLVSGLWDAATLFLFWLGRDGINPFFVWYRDIGSRSATDT